jgi:PAS domain S-box-containing protein
MAEKAQTLPTDTLLFRDIFTASPVGIAVENLEGQPLFVNPALCSMLGFSEKEMCTKHCVEFSPPEDAEKDWALFQQLRAGSIDHYQLEKRYFRRDGSLFWGRLSLSLLKGRSSPLVVARVEDITDERTADEALRASEERLRLAQQAARIQTFEWNIETGVNNWTPELEAMYGLPPGGFGGTQEAFENLVHPDDRARVIELVSDSLKTGQPAKGEWRVVWPDGSVHWLAGRWQVFMDEVGKPSRMLGVNIDIADRKLAEEVLREYERAVEASGEMITVINREHRCLMANREYLNRRNATREQVVGHFAYELVDQRMFEDIFKPKLDECFRGNVIKFEMKYTYPELGERDLSISYYPIEGPDGIDRVACLLLDITDRKQAEHALRESEQRFRLATQAGKMYAFEWNVASDTIVRSGDVAGVLGSTGETELKRHQMRESIHPDDWGQFTTSMRETSPENPDVQMSYRWLRPDGSVAWLEKTAQAFFDEQGKMVRMVGMVTDVTERKRAEEVLSDVSRKLLQAQEQERLRIARELHDDINQRLAILHVELANLAGGHPVSATDLHEAVDKLQTRISDISSGIQAISHRLHSSQLEYLGLVPASQSFCRETAELHKVTIDFKADTVRQSIPHDISLTLFRVLQESLQNAIKHSAAHNFTVQFSGTGSEIQLIVRDQGKGFDVAAVRNKHGLGLISMRERISLVKGTILITSKPAQGTEINVRIPIDKASDADGIASAAA